MNLLRGQCVLVVEDEALIALDVESALTDADAGAEVVGGANTVVRAFDLAETHGLTPAIVDLRLQHQPAAAVAQRLSARGIPFVFDAGHADSTATAEWPGVRMII